ncbi:MAG: phenylalanine--tRNA ligase subunit alpha [Frisingicoccus sp.]
MKDRLEQIRQNALAQIEEAGALEKLNDIRVAFLGKKGELTSIMKSMKEIAPEDRPAFGQMVNETRSEIEKRMEEMKTELARKAREAQLKAEVIDVTLPAKKSNVGHRHPNTIALEEVERIFVGMGYEVIEGPEVEKDYYNFEALNIPDNHPAKDEQDTFYINKEFVLRTQTSGTQVHTMETQELPIRMIAPGRVYRSDEVDATHSPCFHQIEGLVIDKHITFADLKGTLAEFAKELFGEETKVKFVRIISHSQPRGDGCHLLQMWRKGVAMCKGSGWIETVGMVHPMF